MPYSTRAKWHGGTDQKRKDVTGLPRGSYGARPPRRGTSTSPPLLEHGDAASPPSLERVTPSVRQAEEVTLGARRIAQAGPSRPAFMPDPASGCWNGTRLRCRRSIL